VQRFQTELIAEHVIAESQQETDNAARPSAAETACTAGN
jgi:hypothetical protein